MRNWMKVKAPGVAACSAAIAVIGVMQIGPGPAAEGPASGAARLARAEAAAAKPVSTRPAPAQRAPARPAAWPGPKPRPAGAKPPAATAAAPYWTYQDFLDGKTPKTYTIAPQHPRLLITPENKDEMVERAKAAPYVWTKIIADANGSSSAALAACAAIYQLGLVPGFTYSMSREEYGRKGVKLLIDGTQDGRRSHHEAVSYMIVPCAYDWLFDLLTPEQRKTMAGRFTKAAAAAKDKPCTIHGPKMMLGIAFYGDGVDDAAARKIVDDEFKEWWDPKAPSKNLVSLLIYSEDSGSPDGYMSCRTNLAPVLAAWKTATGQDYFAALGFFRGFPYYVAAKFLPSSAWTELPMYNYNAGSMVDCQGLSLLATGFLRDVDPRGAAFCRWWTDQGRGFETLCVRGVEGGKIFFGIVIGDARVIGFSPSELGFATTASFDGGTNTAYVRSAWDDPDATLLGVSSSRYPTNRCHKSANSFSLFKNRAMLFPYRGQLAHHFYTGGKDIDTAPMMFSGLKRVHPRLGGSSAPTGSRAVGTDVNDPLSLASEADQFDYVRSENRAYAGVSQCQRTVVYLRPTAPDKIDHVVILDRFKVQQKDLTPHLVFQSVFEPAVGKDFSAPEEGAKVREGHWRFEKTPCVTVTNEQEASQVHGRAFLKVLTPDVAVLKIGGPKHFADDVDGTPADNRYANFATRMKEAQQVALGGYWRFHVVPQAPADACSVMTAIEATDSKQAEPAGPMELLPGDNLLAGRVGPNLVLFSRGGAAMDSGSVMIKTDGLLRVVIADLKPAREYVVSLGGKAIATAGKSSTAGTLLVKKPADQWPAEGVLEIRPAAN